MSEPHLPAVTPAADTPCINPIFEKLVTEQSDQHREIIGHIAYTLYKRSKREWCREFRSAHGRFPNAADEAAYVEGLTESVLQNFRNEAASIISEFTDYVRDLLSEEVREEVVSGEIGQNLQAFRNEMATGQAGQALQRIEGNQQRFWHDVFIGITAGVGYTAILIILVFVLRFFGLDILHVAERVEPSIPAGSTAQCSDGTYSLSKQACLSHGGVAKMLSGS